MIGGAFRGAVPGVPVTYFGLVLALCSALGGNLCGLPAVFLAPPVGIIGGALIDALITKRFSAI